MMNTKSHIRRRLVIDTIAYCGLLLVSYYLVGGVYWEYMESKTNFAVTKEPLTVKDNPAVLVKFKVAKEITYGIDYVIEAFTWNEAEYTYVKGRPFHA